MLEAPKNLGHRATLATLYGCGVRVSEETNLKVNDIDGVRKVISIRGGKGHKDRQVMLAPSLREVLVAYYRWKHPTDWLFPGAKPDCPISREAVFETCRKAARLAGIAKPVHPHSLRHYAEFRTMPSRLTVPRILARFQHLGLGIVRDRCNG
jgi:site-specific recombinase XerD